MKKIILTLAALALLVSCTNPFVAKATKTASVTVNVASDQSNTGARTIMPDFALSADSYKITLESNGVPPFATKTVTIDTTVSTYTFPSVETGSWNITIDALKSGAVIASGKLLNKTLETEGLTASIILNPVINSGTGDFSFKFQFPASLGVTNVSCTLYNEAGDVVIPGTDDLNLSGTTDIIATFTNIDSLPSGSYSIVTKFLSNSIDIGSFRELVNIFPNTESNKWVQADGSLADKRIFASADFGSVNNKLLNLEIVGLTSSQVGFSSNVTNYTLYDIPTGTLSIRATESVPGQKITYSYTGLASAEILSSGVFSRPFMVAPGDKQLIVTVTAPKGGQLNSYTFNIKQNAFYTSTSPISMQMVSVPAGAFQRDATPTNTSYVSSFYMGKYEVSQSQYKIVMGVNPSSDYSSVRQPVDSINFYRAITFCNKLSLIEGLTPVYSVIKNGNEIDWSGIIHENIPTTSDAAWNAVVMNVSANGYRLPTEMEWRWVAMGATKDARSLDIVNEVNVLGYTKGYAGSTEAGNLQVNIGNYTWYKSNSGVGGTITDPRTIQPVGTKLPNELGIYDLSGNVWEWCWDVLVDYPSGPLTNYTGSSIARSASTTSMFVGAGYDDTLGVNSLFLLNNRSFTNRSPQDGPTAVGFRVARNSEKLALLYTANQDGTMSAYKITEKNGGLVKLSTYNKGADTNPLYAVMVHPNRKFLYAIGRDGSTSSIYTYTINPLSGGLLYISASAKVTGTETCQILIDPTGNYLYTCNTQSANISIFKIALDGTLTVVEQNFSLGLSGSVPLRMAMTPDGKYLYTANYIYSEDDENLSMLSINAADGRLSQIPGSPFKVSTRSANSLIISPDGKYLYVSEYNGCIEQFEINTDGSLISKQILTGTGWQNYLYIDPSARFLYFCAYGFYGVTRNTSTGTMTYLKENFTNSLQTEKDGLLVFAPYGNWAYSNTTNAIELLSHNTVSGALQFVRNISTAEQVNDLVSMYLY